VASPGSVEEAGKVIQEIWTRKLGISDIRKTDNFFELGGHSLLAVEAHRDLRDALGTRTLSIADFFRFPTLGALTTHVEGLLGASASEKKEAVPEPATSEVTNRRRDLRRRRGSGA